MIRLVLTLALVLIGLTPNPGEAETRVALVIGNSAYTQVPALPNPKNDAAAISTALDRLGFTVLTGLDQSISEMRDLIRAFSEQAEGADLALFFYAGHGLQVAGNNYLLPVDAALERERDLDFAAIDLQLVLRQLEESAKNSVILLDACRDNPFETALTRSMGNTRSAVALGRGLAPVETLGGALIGFATDPGREAYDGQGQHSPFTEALLKHIETPGLEINAMMTRVRADVVAATSLRQRPWATSSLLDELFLAPETEDAPDPVLEDVAAWRAAEADGSRVALETYLNRFPEGLFVEQAERGLAIVTAPVADEDIAALPVPKARAEREVTEGSKPNAAQPSDLPLYGMTDVDAHRFRTIPPGRFRMGSDTADATPAEKPVVDVVIARFRLLRDEVTVRDFRLFVVTSDHQMSSGCYVWTQSGRMRWRDTASWENPGFPVSDDTPVACVNWHDAQAYLAWLNRSGGGGAYRLPSEAEFEYAVRAGTIGEYPFEGGAEAACLHANAADVSSRFRWRNTACNDGHAAVAKASELKPNAYGLTGMLGNLWEWTADCWNPSHHGVSVAAPARQTGQCDSRVLRGGSWDDPFANLRSSYRVGIPAKRRQANVGFRVVLGQ